jgi:hypothetical protein
LRGSPQWRPPVLRMNRQALPGDDVRSIYVVGQRRS